MIAERGVPLKKVFLMVLLIKDPYRCSQFESLESEVGNGVIIDKENMPTSIFSDISVIQDPILL